MRIDNRILWSIILVLSGILFRNYSVLASEQPSGDFTNPIIITEPPTYNWTQMSRVSTDTLNETSHPSHAVDSIGNVHVVWVDSTNYSNAGFDSDIFYRYLDRNTGNWSITEVISVDSLDNSYTPEIAIDQNDRINVVWVDETPAERTDADADVFFSYKDENTGEWSPMEQVSTHSTEESSHPSIAVDSVGDVYVVWQDATNYESCGLDWDIFFKIRGKSLDVWLPTQVISTESSGDSVEPYIVVDTQRDVHVVWSDSTDFGIPDDHVPEKIVHKYRDITDLTWSDLKIIEMISLSIVPPPPPPPSINIFVYKSSPIIKLDSDDGIYIAYHQTDVDVGIHGTVPPTFSYSLIYHEVNAEWIKHSPDASPSYPNITTTVIDSFTHPDLSSYTITVHNSSMLSRPALSVDIQSNVHLAFSAKIRSYFFPSATGTDCVFYLQMNSSNSNIVFTENGLFSSTPTLSTDTKGRINLVWQDSLYHNESDTHLDIFHSNCIVAPLAPILNDVSYRNGEVTLDWTGYGFVDSYYILRDTKLITPFSAYSLEPVALISTDYFTEFLFVEDEYYYAIIARNILANGTVSNCISIDFKLGFINTFNIDFWTFSGIVGGLSATSIILLVNNIRIRK